MRLPTQNAIFKRIEEFTRNNPDFKFTITKEIMRKDKFPYCKYNYLSSLIESEEHEDRIARSKTPLFYVSTGKGLIKVYTFNSGLFTDEICEKLAKAQLEGSI